MIFWRILYWMAVILYSCAIGVAALVLALCVVSIIRIIRDRRKK